MFDKTSKRFVVCNYKFMLLMIHSSFLAYQLSPIFKNEHFYMGSRLSPRFDFERLDFGAKAGRIRTLLYLFFGLLVKF